MNPKLRTVLLKARSENMPADNIERAIKEGTGELPGVVYEEFVYEGYAPHGVAVVVEVTTDNKNRAASEVRSTFPRTVATLAELVPSPSCSNAMGNSSSPRTNR